MSVDDLLLQAERLMEALDEYQKEVERSKLSGKMVLKLSLLYYVQQVSVFNYSNYFC